MAFFGVSFISNALASGTHHTLRDWERSSQPRPALIMWRILNAKDPQSQDHWEWHSRAMFNFVKYRRAFKAVIQSASIYSMASISLVATLLTSPNVGFVACMNAFPPLIVCQTHRYRQVHADAILPGVRVFAHRPPNGEVVCCGKPLS